MRFLELHLRAFGPFTDRVLDLASPPGALHIVYGPNEAGKSTALRAVTALLFGVPQQTGDAHLHRMPELRVGALLQKAGQEPVFVVRRKGLKSTLADRDGKPLDDALLERMLGGVSEGMFRAMFGLDHEALRRGAEALLEGRGDVGESLFEAGLGGPWLHQLVRDLREEADGLFTERARNKPLNEALRALKEAQRSARDAAMSPSAWIAQEQAIEEATAERARLAQAERELKVRATRLHRARRVLPGLAKRTDLLARRRALGDVVRLPEAAAREREEAERVVDAAGTHAARLAEEAARLEARLAALSIPMSLVALPMETLNTLSQGLGSHLKAAADLPRVRGELSLLEDEARAILRRLGRDVALADVEALRVTAATHARIRKLSLRPASLEPKLEHLARSRAETERRLAGDRERRARLPAAPSIEARDELARALARAQKQGDLDDRARASARELARLEAEAEDRAAGLAPWKGSIDRVASIPVVPIETIDRHERAWAEHDRKREQLRDRWDLLEKRESELARDLDALQRAGAVPTEEELGEARADRDALWTRLLDAWSSGDAHGAVRGEIDAALRAQAEADAIADRLRREAGRVASLARLLADRAALSDERAGLVADREEALARTARQEGAWRALWEPASITPRSPAEMRGWHARHAEIVAHLARTGAARAQHEELVQLATALRDKLAAALASVGEPVPDADDLGAVVDRAQRAKTALDRAEATRADLDVSIATHEETLALRVAESAEVAAQIEAFRGAWGGEVRALGLPEDAGPEEAIAVLDRLGELFQKVDDAQRASKRVSGMERDRRRFEVEVEQLVRDHAPDLAGVPAEKAASELVARYQAGAKDLTESREIASSAARVREQLRAEEARRKEAAARVDALMRAAGATDAGALREAERRSDEARQIDAALRALDDQLLADGDGASLEALAREAEGQSADALAVEKAEVDDLIEAASDALSAADRDIGAKKAGLGSLGGGEGAAADAAGDAEHKLARVRACVNRYLRAKLASYLLDREIERYREEHQGPVLGRASELFHKLTLARYAGLTTGYDASDQAVLRCVRDGVEVPVEGLSDGTRDQLYLSLRVASLERMASRGELLPLVVDDVLIHFDDDRARAALAILGDLASRTQVLFFTHHRRLLELGREVVPAARLREHVL